MALILKTGQVFNDKHGTEHAAAYAVIDWVLTDKEKKTHDIRLDIYKDKAARDSNLQPLERIRINCIDEIDFNNYFSCVATCNKDLYEQSYTYVSNLKDEEDNLIYIKWQRDQ